jgi:hypothetical protein
MTTQRQYVLSKTLRFSIASILAVAASLKTLEALSISQGNISQYVGILGLVVIELFCAVWYLMGIWPRLASDVVLALFIIFTLVSIARAVGGEKSCGCLGHLVVSPWLIAPLDAVLAALVWIIRPLPRQSGLRPQSLAIQITFLLMLATGVAGYAELGGHKHLLRWTSAMHLLTDDSETLLEPETWIGRPFPLCEQVQLQDSAESICDKLEGKIVVLLVRAGCDQCRDAMLRYEKLIDTPNCDFQGMVVLNVDDSSRSFEHVQTRPRITRGRLKKTTKWQVQTPVILVTVDGEVVAAGAD